MALIVEKELLVAVSDLLGEFTSSLEEYLAKISKQEEGLYGSFYRLKELLRGEQNAQAELAINSRSDENE